MCSNCSTDIPHVPTSLDGMCKIRRTRVQTFPQKNLFCVAPVTARAEPGGSAVPAHSQSPSICIADVVEFPSLLFNFVINSNSPISKRIEGKKIK